MSESVQGASNRSRQRFSIQPPEFAATEFEWPRFILLSVRPIWQIAIAIIVLYQLPGQAALLRAALAVSVAIFIAADILLLANIDDARWLKIRLWVVHIELITAALIAAYMIDLVPQGPACLLLLPTLLTYTWLNRRGSHRFEVWTALISAALFIATMHLSLQAGILHQDGRIEGVLLGLYGMIIIFIWIFAWMLRNQWYERHQLEQLVRKLQFQSEQLTRVNDEVNAYANRVYDLATAEERNRVAGEIHDTVAHRLTALLVQLQGARRMLETGDKASARENMQVSEELTRESLDEVRKSVRDIRRNPGGEGIDALRRLTLHYASLTGMTIQFDVAHDIEAIPAQLMAMLYRVIQEGLTNAQRHGRATQVNIDMVRCRSLLVLTIQDNGKGAVTPVLGFGLSSMRTRLLPFGGDIRVESQPGSGFTLELTLPLWEGVS